MLKLFFYFTLKVYYFNMEPPFIITFTALNVLYVQSAVSIVTQRPRDEPVYRYIYTPPRSNAVNFFLGFFVQYFLFSLRQSVI